jgi:sterol desaturase/sphingolipid hydroxylase (fatty acid hydroxylase superfamily)
MQPTATASAISPATLLRGLLFPATLLLALAATALGLRSGLPAMPLQFGGFLAALAIVALAERLMPQDAGHGAAAIDWKVDALSFGAVMTIVNPVLELGLPLLAAGLLAAAALPPAADWFPTHWPLPAKVTLAAVIAEFGQYWLHRLAHEWPPLWRFHASHHSSERLYWLNGFRVHPANVVWHHLAGVFVLKLIGADVETLALCLTMAGVVSAFQHANLRLVFGPLNWIFSTNDLHRWHHADRPDEANRNYGGMLSIWDLVFGTYLHRPGRQPERYGLFPGNESYPRDNWWAQLAVPFLRRHRRS